MYTRSGCITEYDINLKNVGLYMARRGFLQQEHVKHIALQIRMYKISARLLLPSACLYISPFLNVL